MDNRLIGIIRKWWIVLATGIVSVVLGIAVAANPGSGFGAVKIIVLLNYLLVAALAIVIIYKRRYAIPAWGWELAAAIALFVIGVVLAFTPAVSDGLLVALFAVGFILEGVSGVSGSVVLKRLNVSGWGLNMVLAVLTILCGIMLIFKPVVAVLSIDLLVAVAMMSFGITLIMISYRLSKLNGSINMAERNAVNLINAVKEAQTDSQQKNSKEET